MKWSRYLSTLFLTFAFVIPLHQNCGRVKPKNTEERALSSAENIQCEITKEAGALSVEDTFSFSKLSIRQPESSDPSALAQSVLKAGRRFSVLVNHECLAAQGGFISESFRNESGPAVTTHSYTLNEDIVYADFETAAELDNCLAAVSDPVTISIEQVTSDPRSPEQNHLRDINESESTDFFFNDPNTAVTEPIIVAVIDTGVDIRHVDLRNQLWTNTKETPGNGVDDDSNGYVDDVNGYNFASNIPDPGPEAVKGILQSHGTHVAGLIAAQANNAVGIQGVMGAKIQIMSLNIFGKAKEIESNLLENAIRYAADNGASVINMSVAGCGSSGSVESALLYAESRGATLVAAAGNNGKELSGNPGDMMNCGTTQGPLFMMPASYVQSTRGMIVVGSVDVGQDHLSGFSNFSAGIVDVAAPGDDPGAGGILSCIPGNQYGYKRGTSMAAPIGSGSVALLRAFMKTHNIGLGLGSLKRTFLESSHQSIALSSKIVSGRRLDMGGLVQKARELRDNPHTLGGCR